MTIRPPRVFPGGLLPFEIPAGSFLFRVHLTSYSPIWFGPGLGRPPQYRFDAPGGEYGSLYCAEELTGAFVETVLRRANRIVRRDFVEKRSWTVLRARRDLTLAKLHDEGLIWHETTSDICAGDNYSDPQLIARDLFLAFGHLDGIAYRARHNNGQICYVLFDRVAPVDIEPIDTRSFANERSISDRLMRIHNAVWDTTAPTVDLRLPVPP